jgi:HK97 family phage prohead protease
MMHEMPLAARERKFTDVSIGTIGRDGTFSGYASLFGKVDLARDMVEPGAFARALRLRGATGVRMLYQHDPAQPIGTWLELREDERGLFVRGRLARGVARAGEVLELMRSGALDGLSIGFRTVKARRDTKSGVRRIVEADLWEISIVTFPMLPGARIESVKDDASALPSVRDFERWLTRDAKLTRGEARTGFAYSANIAAPATIGELVGAAGKGPEGRFDHHGSITVALLDGALSSVPVLQLLNGANTAVIRSDSGAWEVIQFGSAEEIAPSVWRLTTLLRGQQGTGDALAAGASAGAPFVLIDHAVVKAGLQAEHTGLALNWMVGPTGQDFGGPTHVGLAMAGGIRARLPLAPVHLHVARQSSGDALVTWTRRGRIDADSWLSEDIPLGEEHERYRVEVRAAGDIVVRTAETANANWTYDAAWIASDLPALPAEIEITVRQISATAGAGLPTIRSFMLS